MQAWVTGWPPANSGPTARPSQVPHWQTLGRAGDFLCAHEFGNTPKNGHTRALCRHGPVDQLPGTLCNSHAARRREPVKISSVGVSVANRTALVRPRKLRAVCHSLAERLLGRDSDSHQRSRWRAPRCARDRARNGRLRRRRWTAESCGCDCRRRARCSPHDHPEW